MNSGAPDRTNCLQFGATCHTGGKKTQLVSLIRRSLEELEFATLEWVEWFNNRRLLEPIGDIPPAEFEEMYYERQEGSTMSVGVN